jgi:hypothetical protein
VDTLTKAQLVIGFSWRVLGVPVQPPGALPVRVSLQELIAENGWPGLIRVGETNVPISISVTYGQQPGTP